MKFTQQCSLFVFAILIGLAVLLLPFAAMASLSVLSCGKASFRLDEAADKKLTAVAERKGVNRRTAS